MRIRQTVALGLAMALATGLIMQPLGARGAQGSGSISGIAKDAKKPYPKWSVRARNTVQGTIASTVPLDQDAKFALNAIDPAKYVVELLNEDGKVVCTEGPFDLTQQPNRPNVVIDCGNPAAWWLLAAAAAAGITAGVVAAGPASPSR
jgi:hypothetical protein